MLALICSDFSSWLTLSILGARGLNFHARFPVSVSLDPREKPAERSAVPLMEGACQLMFQIDRRLKYFRNY